MYVGILDPQTHLLPLQVIAGSAAVWSMGRSQHGTSRSDFPTWPWVTSQEAVTLGQPKPNCGYCKSSARICTSLAGLSAWVQHGDVVAVPLHHTQLVGLMLLVTIRESLSLGDPRLCHGPRPGWTLMLTHGCLAGNLPIQQHREQSKHTQCSANPAQPTALKLLRPWEELGSKSENSSLSGWCFCSPKKAQF